MKFRLLILSLGAMLAGCAATPYGGYSGGYLGTGPYYGATFGYPYGYDRNYGHRDRGFLFYPVAPHHRHDHDRFRKHRRWHDDDRHRHDRGDWRDRDRDRDHDRDRFRDDRRQRDDRHGERERELRATRELDGRSARPLSERAAPARQPDPEPRVSADGERAFTETAPQERRRQSER